MEHIRIEQVPMPANIKACTVRCYEDADYFTVFINVSLSEQAQWLALQHELEHIKMNDFCTVFSATELEEWRHLNEKNDRHH